eukprot:TRINITY_DN47450_c0_g1_i1.p1 TRINITY_DN47450_c0_g1~~TRINITY_DN47450_c0_g1_i1.p1  ORF type:complete len:386 (+),score=33.55 TRINITY_DN47450_c0_g1_i1:85-1158(+)
MALPCLVLLGVFVAPSLAHAKAVTLSNIKLPVDQDGTKLITGEADILQYNGAYYLYFNNWGTCPGINCCDSKAGCASCCFDSPPHPYSTGCESHTNGSDPYGQYHTVQAYRTTDFETFENLGMALPLSARRPGIMFRPHVVFNAKTSLFVMWYEDRSSNARGSGYSVATSSTPGGPFQTIETSVPMRGFGFGSIGDYDIFVDDDGSAYHVRTGFDVVKLNDNYTGPAEHMSSFRTPKSSEGPVMFKRNGTYYVLSGTGCCACIGGSTIYVDIADSPKGPWKFVGDIGSNPSPFDAHSPNNYVTKAQASAVFEVAGAASTSYVWVGNQWNSGLSEPVPGPRNHDLLYWTVLNFRMMEP